jgi:glycosyltransferase involved in cell wall biosynthesis
MVNESLAERDARCRRQGASAAVTVDVAGARIGGAARFKSELDRYLERTGRDDVRIIGTSRHVGPAWLLRREMTRPSRGRFVALNNVGFVTSGGERWTLLRNALHFLRESEEMQLDPAVRAAARREAAIVRMAARRSDVLVTPSTAMAERIGQTLPKLHRRVIVRPHPVSADSIPDLPRDPAILCPILFAAFKQMVARLTELLAAVEEHGDPSIRLRITADRSEVPADLRCNPRIELCGRLSSTEVREVWGRSRAVYFPTGIESFGYPLAEARASGRPVIARDTPQNREIGGRALCGFTPGDMASLRTAVERALSEDVAPDPAPFDPDIYFGWLLGTPQ